MEIYVSMDKNYGGHPMQDYDITVQRGSSTEMVWIEFKNKNEKVVLRGGSVWMPRVVAAQLARALMLMAETDTQSPIVLTIEEGRHSAPIA